MKLTGTVTVVLSSDGTKINGTIQPANNPALVIASMAFLIRYLSEALGLPPNAVLEMLRDPPEMSGPPRKGSVP